MKLFVIVRRDLTTSQSAVQAGHVVAEYLLHSRTKSWKNETLIYLGVKDLFHLEKLIHQFDLLSTPYTVFREPDLDNEITAIATDNGNKYIERLRLL